VIRVDLCDVGGRLFVGISGLEVHLNYD
jgi:hypothetical protein